MTSAKGRIRGMIDGRTSVARRMKASTDWPLSVTRLTLASACVVQTIAISGKSVAKNMPVARFRI
ncbi:hypothetical protein D9M69_703920 [compost metagenome]